jgi:hypothetical protein
VTTAIASEATSFFCHAGGRACQSQKKSGGKPCAQ